MGRTYESGLADTSITVMYWRAWVKDAPQQAVSRGHELIMSPVSHHYFDYEPDHTTLKRVYDYDPVAGLNKPNAVIGMQANIWTEWIPTVSRLDYMTMPRMIALAENAWSKTKDWNSFSNRMALHYSRLDTMNIHYRLPDIMHIKEHNVFIDTTTITITVPAGVTAVHYSTDGSQPTSKSPQYTKPFVTDSSMTLMLTLGYESRAGNRYTIRYEKQSCQHAVKVTETKSGLRCRYYEGEYSSVLEIAEKDLKHETHVTQIMFPPQAGSNRFALTYSGLIEVPFRRHLYFSPIIRRWKHATDR